MSEEEEEILDIESEIYDASDGKTINNARKKGARLRQKRLMFVREMMKAPFGRLWVYDMLVMGHLTEPTFTPGDSHATAFKEGERNFVNKIIYDIMEAAPETYAQMLEEGRNEK